MDNTSRATHRSWDVAPSLLLGVALGLLGQVLADARTGWAALLSLAGVALVLSSLLRWSRRSRRRAAALDLSRGSVTTAA